MAQNKITAAETLRRLAVQYTGIVEAADVLASLGSLEQATAEAVAARDAAFVDRDAARAEADAARSGLESDKAAAVLDLARIAAEGDAVRAQGVSDAEAIIERAKAQAAEVIAAAEAQVAATAEAHTALEAAAHGRLNAINVDIANATAMHDQAAADAAAAQSQLDAIRASIAALAKG